MSLLYANSEIEFSKDITQCQYIYIYMCVCVCVVCSGEKELGREYHSYGIDTPRHKREYKLGDCA